MAQKWRCAYNLLCVPADDYMIHYQDWRVGPTWKYDNNWKDGGGGVLGFERSLYHLPMFKKWKLSYGRYCFEGPEVFQILSFT